MSKSIRFGVAWRDTRGRYYLADLAHKEQWTLIEGYALTFEHPQRAESLARQFPGAFMIAVEITTEVK